jgi:hypothetical protein
MLARLLRTAAAKRGHMRTGSRTATGVGLLVVGVALASGSVRRWIAGVLGGTDSASPNDLVAFAPHPSGDGGWALDRSGNIFAFGSAPEFREVPQPEPWRRASFVGIASTPSGRGVWTLDRRGNIFAFGDAPEFREVPEPVPWRETSFATIASTASGQGVWIMDRRGRIFSFGDARDFHSARQNRGER